MWSSPSEELVPMDDKRDGAPELSVVLPCLNEAQTLAGCIDQILRTTRGHGIDAEIIVADNGSDDGSPGIARALGARVVAVKERGYGSALSSRAASATRNSCRCRSAAGTPSVRQSGCG